MCSRVHESAERESDQPERPTMQYGNRAKQLAGSQLRWFHCARTKRRGCHALQRFAASLSNIAVSKSCGGASEWPSESTSNAFHRARAREAVPRCTYSTRSTTCATVTCTVQMDVRTDATGSSSGLCPSSSHEVEQFACFLRKLVGRRELMPRCLDPSRHSLRGVRREDPENMHFCILGT